MNIRCPHCQTVFRVNPERIPAGGVRAKCARCGDTFMVTPSPAESRAASAAPAPPMRAAATTTPAAPSRAAATTTPAAPPPTAAATTPAAPPRAAATTTPPASRPPAQQQDALAGASAPAPSVSTAAAQASGVAMQATAPASPVDAAEPAQVSGPPMFGARDPRAKAERLARALVSDIVAYHPERRDRSLESGTLRTEFREEIMKSWEEYVAQVGLETAKSTPYFRDALNAILARGQKLF